MSGTAAETSFMSVKNAALYRRMSEPLPVAEREAKCKAFEDDLKALREKYSIQDLYVVAVLPTDYGQGGEGTINLVLHCGDSARRESIAAWAYGHEQGERQKTIGFVMSEAMRAVSVRESV